MHSAVLLVHRGKRLLLDAGETWRGHLRTLRPDWIAITHTHPDHSFALAEGTDVPVYVSPASYELLKKYPVKHFRIFENGQTIRLGPFKLTPYDVVHSIRAPAVGFRLSIPNEAEVLHGIDAYIWRWCDASSGAVTATRSATPRFALSSNGADETQLSLRISSIAASNSFRWRRPNCKPE